MKDSKRKSAGLNKKKSGQKKMERNAPVSNNIRAGVIFPVGRCNRMIRRGRYSDRVGASAGVFMAAVLEYLCSEILELSQEQCEIMKTKTIKPKHINMAIRCDNELNKLICLSTISESTKPYHVNDFLLPDKKKGKETGDASQAM